VDKYDTDRQATDDSIIRRMRFACWITKATDTHSKYVILIAFQGNNGYANALEGCVICISTVLLIVSSVGTKVDRTSQWVY
jgi:hypothetical protein